MKLSHSPAAAIPIVKQLWLEFFLLKLAHFFISEVAQFFIDKGKPYSKMLNDGILELRAKVGSDISRVLSFFIVGKKVVLTNGFIKKTQKTPKEELERAKQYRAEYISRKERDLP